MVSMKRWICIILSLCTCVALAAEKPSPESLEGCFRKLLQSMVDNNSEVIQVVSTIEDEESLKQACEFFRMMYERMDQMSVEVEAFKKELEQLGMKPLDFPGSESLMSDFRYIIHLQKMKLKEQVSVLMARLEKGDLGDPDQAVALVERGIPVFFTNYEDVDKKHADTVMRMQQFIMLCEMTIIGFSAELMGITDEESAEKAAGFVVDIKPIIRDLQMKMDMYALDDPQGYEPIRESIEERIMSVNDAYISAIQNVLKKDCYGCKVLQDALQDYIAPMKE